VAQRLRIQEALALGEHDLDPRRGSLLVRSGESGRRREIGMDVWGFEQLRPWLAARVELPIGPLFCIIVGPAGGPGPAAMSASSSAGSPSTPGIRRRFAPHQLRHAHAVELGSFRASSCRWPNVDDPACDRPGADDSVLAYGYEVVPCGLRRFGKVASHIFHALLVSITWDMWVSWRLGAGVSAPGRGCSRLGGR
jgi:hypothetical protein